MRSSDSRADGGRPRSKVARVIDEYDLEGVGDEIEQRWIDTDDSGMSLRELADYFNRAVLESAIESNELSALDADVDQLYVQLTDDGVSSGVRTRVERRLDRNGIDVDAVTSDFVTHQSVHTYLRKYRQVEQPERTAEERRAAALERIQNFRTGQRPSPKTLSRDSSELTSFPRERSTQLSIYRSSTPTVANSTTYSN